MISLSQFRHNLFPIFKLMQSTGMTIDVYHNRVAYKVMVIPTHEPVKIIYKPRVPRRLAPEAIHLSECPLCGNMRVADVCMNRKCTKSAPQPK